MEDTASCAGSEHIHLEWVVKGKHLTSFGTVECKVLFLGDALPGSVDPLIAHGTTTYSNCELGGGSCTETEENGPGEIKIKKEGHETGKVTYESLAHLVCSGFIDCSYNGVGLVGTAKGPLLSTQTNGEVTISEQTLAKEAGGFLCPKISKLDITMTPLLPTYLL